MIRSAALTLATIALAVPVLAGEEPYSADDRRIEPPVRVHTVQPVYPQAALYECAEAAVTLEATIGKDGRVTDVQAVETYDFNFGVAASGAVSQWLYEPGRSKSSGQAVVVTMPVTVRFESPCTEPKDSDLQPIPVTEGIQPPEKIIAPRPRYTHAARRACIEGTVILEAIVDTEGNVVSAQILKDLPDGLGQAAKRTVEEWKYEPARLPNGEPVAVYFTFTVNFSVDGECRHPESERPLVLTPVDTPRPQVGDLTGRYTAVPVISKNGNVKAVETVFATDPKLTKPVRNTLRKWRYEPPVDPETGRKTRAETTVSFDF